MTVNPHPEHKESKDKETDGSEGKDAVLGEICRRVFKWMPPLCAIGLLVQVCGQGFYPVLVTMAEILRPEPHMNQVCQVLYGSALNSARMQYPKNDMRIATGFYDLANVQLKAAAPQEAQTASDGPAGADGNLDGAMANARAAMNICTAMFGVSNPCTNRCQSVIAMIHRAGGDNQNALKFEQRVLKSCRELYGDTHVSVANKLEDIAAHHRHNHNLDLAVEYQHQSLKVRQKLWGEDSRYTVQDLIEVGEAYTKLGAAAHGLELYTKALAISNKQPDAAGDQGGRIRQKISEWYYARNNYEKALFWSREKLAKHKWSPEMKTKESLLPADHEAIGRCLVKLSRWQEAIKELKEAERIDNKVFGLRSEYAARTEQWLAMAYEKGGEHKKAEDALVEAVAIYDDIRDGKDVVQVFEADGYDGQTARYAQANLALKLGKEDVFIERLHKQLKQEEDEGTRSQALQILYSVQARAGKWKAAADTYDRYLDSLVALREDAGSVKNIRDFRHLRSVGETRLYKQDSYGAIDALSKAVRLGDQLSELDDRELCEVLTILASVELRAEKFSEAGEHLDTARKLAEQENRRSKGRADNAYTLSNVEWCIAADYLMTVGRCEEALSHFQRALSILRKLEAHRKDTYVCLNDYAACLRVLGQVSAAEKAEREAQAIENEADYDIHRAGECIAMHSGEKTFLLAPSKHAHEQILQGPVTLMEALYIKTLGDDVRSKGKLDEARTRYMRALEYMKVLHMDETVYAAPIKRDLARARLPF
jgi:tetratricopeptide (TPR) repeat protein